MALACHHENNAINPPRYQIMKPMSSSNQYTFSSFLFGLAAFVSIFLMMPTEAVAGCSSDIGKIVINEINHHNQSCDYSYTHDVFVELRALDMSIVSSQKFQDYTMTVCAVYPQVEDDSDKPRCYSGNPVVGYGTGSNGATGTNPEIIYEPALKYSNAENSGNAWIVLYGDSGQIPKCYLDVNADQGNTSHGMELVLYDKQGDIVDYHLTDDMDDFNGISSKGYVGNGGCTFAYDTEFNGANSFNVQKVPDGTGCWPDGNWSSSTCIGTPTKPPSGNSGTETTNTTNDILPSGTTDVPLVVIGNDSMINSSLSSYTDVDDLTVTPGSSATFTLKIIGYYSLANETVNLSRTTNEAGSAIQINYMTLDGTATAGSDYTGVTGNIDSYASIASGANSTTITIPTSTTASIGEIFNILLIGVPSSTTAPAIIHDFSDSATFADLIPPAAPTIDLLASSDTGTSSTDNLTSDNTPTIRIRLQGTGSSAPVVGDIVKLYDGTTLVGTAILTATNITNGYVDITSSPLSNGTHTFKSTVTDQAGNISPDSATLSITIDTTPPTISIISDKPSLMAGETATLTFTLSEASTNFATGDISVAGGTLSNFSGSGTIYTATFTPTANSTANGEISVATNTFSDAAENTNTIGDSLSLTVDTARPTIAITSSDSSLQDGDTPTITFTLSEASTDFTADDITVTGGTLSGFNGSGTTYTATFTPTANSTANGEISVATNTFSDAAENTNTIGDSLSLTVDTARPTIAITSSDSSLQDGDTPTITFTLSEASTDFTADDITVTGGTLSGFNGSGTTYTAIFTPTANSTANGEISVATNTFSDAAENTNAIGDSLSLIVDTANPSITSVISSWGNSLSASEDDNNGTITINTNGVEDDQTVTVTLNGKTYIAIVTDNSATLTVSATDLQALTDGSNYDIVTNVSDAAGNPAPTNTTMFSVDVTSAIIDLSYSDNNTLNYSTLTNTPATATSLDNPNDQAIITESSDQISSISLTIDQTKITDNTNEKVLFGSDAAGVLNANMLSGDVSNLSITIDSVTVAIDIADDDSNTMTITKNGGGSFTVAEAQSVISAISYQNDTVTPTQGERTFEFRVIDSASNESGPALSTITIDTTPPTAPTVDKLYTNNLTPTITGTTGTGSGLNDGETMKVTINSKTYTVVPNADGSWSLNLATTNPDGEDTPAPALTSGVSYEVDAVVTDATGNLATDTTTNELTIDTTPPVIDLDPSTDSSDHSVLTNQPNNIISLDDSGDAATVIEVNGITVLTIITSGILDSGENLIFDNQTLTANGSSGVINATIGGIDVIITNNSAGQFEIRGRDSNGAPITLTATQIQTIIQAINYQHSGATITDGTRTIEFVATDLANNNSTPVNTTIKIDTIVAAPVITPQPLTTSNRTPSLTGTYDHNDVTELSISITDSSGTILGPFTLSSPELTVDGSGNWTLNLNGQTDLANGTYQVVATATDAAGNSATDSSSDELTVNVIDVPGSCEEYYQLSEYGVITEAGFINWSSEPRVATINGNNIALIPGNTPTPSGSVTTVDKIFPSFSPLEFPATGTTDLTINSAATVTSGSYRTITINTTELVTFDATGGDIVIATLTAGSNSNINLTSGNHFINDGSIGASSSITKSGSDTTSIYVNWFFQIGSDTKMNASGLLSDMTIYLYSNASFSFGAQTVSHSSADFVGAIYSPYDNTNVSLGAGTDFHGAILSEGRSDIGDEVDFTYSASMQAELLDALGCPVVNHIRIEHDGSGTPNDPETITVKLCGDDSCSPDNLLTYQNSLSVTLSATPSTGTVTWDDGGGAIFNLIDGSGSRAMTASEGMVIDLRVDSLTIGIGGQAQTLPTTQCYDTTAGAFDCYLEISAQGPHHYGISHAGNGVTCEAATVMITAYDYDASGELELYPVTTDTPITISATATDGTLDDNLPASVTMLAGSATVTVAVEQRQEATLDLDVTDGHAQEDSTKDPALIFSDTLIQFVTDKNSPPNTTIATQVGGLATTDNLYLRVVRSDASSGSAVCVSGLESGTHQIDLGYQCIEPATCPDTLSANQGELELTPTAPFDSGNSETIHANNSGSTAYVNNNIAFDFDSEGYAPFSFRYDNVGKIKLFVKNYDYLGTTINGSESNAFVVKPHSLSLSGSGTTPYKAGEGGGVTLTALLADGTAATQFGKESSPQLRFGYETNELEDGELTITVSSTTANPIDESQIATFNMGSGSYTEGALTANVNWNESGLFDLMATVPDYLGTGELVVESSLQFIPYAFKLAILGHGALENTHTTSSSPFTYVGETFGFESLPQFTITATALGETTTTNYAGSWDDKIGGSAPIALAVLTGTDNGHTWTLESAEYQPGPFSAGISTATLLSAEVEYTPLVSPVVPFVANIDPAWSFTVTDKSYSTITATQTLTFDNLIGNNLRYGRATLSDTYGNETETQSMLFNVEYFDNDGNWIVNEDDTTTTITVNGGISCSVADKDSDSTPDFTCSVDGAVSDLKILDPEESIPAEAGVTPQEVITLDPKDAGIVGEATLSLTGPDYLRFDWDNDGNLIYDSATATFGIYRGDDRFYYWREER
ncbi:hypothetical protein D5085_07010 [Ectothiorhodospiraceae bacterium BW-2]|nr:hypothetical protein D5085_07010 [Ectothiorhodospiraceae bacterium BW-2]